MYNFQRKKFSGASRKVNNIIHELKAVTMTYPENIDEEKYLLFHLPDTQGILDSEKASNFVKKLVTQVLVDCTKHLYDIKPNDKPFCKVNLVIDFEDLFSSQIVVFFDDSHFKEFFIRDSEHQKWSPLDEDCIELKQWGIKIPECFTVKGYSDTVVDDGYIYSGKLWFIGELE